jgi:GNAT superfamily N-acetyltransferase
MNHSYTIEPHNPEESTLKALLFDGINLEAFKAKKLSPIEPFALCAKNPSGKVLGGINGITYYGCLYIDMLWIESACRHQGLGKALMHHAETLGKARKCHFSTVNTMDWEALGFYKKLGYSIEFTRTGYQNNSICYLLRKDLTLSRL